MTTTGQRASDGRVAVWVPFTGSGTEDDQWRPDLPAGVAFSVDAGVPNAVADEVFLQPVHPESGMRQPFVTRYVLAWVDPADVERVTQAVPADQVPLEERLLVEMYGRVRRDSLARLTPEATAEIVAVFEREAAAPADAARREMLEQLRRRMWRRGLPKPAAKHVRDLILSAPQVIDNGEDA